MIYLYDQHIDFNSVVKSKEFRKAIFGLSFFHSVLIERQKFRGFGWMSNYEFDETDFLASMDVLAMSMGLKDEQGKLIDKSFNESNQISWSNVSNLISDFYYNGKVSDSLDRRFCVTFARNIFNENLIA